MTKNDPEFIAFRELCNQHGLAATVQRFLVYQTLREMHNHPTPDMIFERLHPACERVSRMSVYRILEQLSRCRIIRRLNHPGSSMRYDAFMYPHHHLICVDCGAVYDIPCGEEVPFTLPSEYVPDGAIVLDYTIDFQGLCRKCAAESMKNERV
ncbi:MAG: transcriptional repressor [Thermoguttaceae bacterium]|nr:transcriptional repressor [Thermoguttaceae bacterium]MBQ9454324.1 transcriptional repressor [Thermoguttaceae bacterium]MDO4859142.1 transcriptional repressor [Thermoguttaceae bacterium]